MYEICTLLSSFGQKMYDPKVLNIGPFRCTTYVEPDQNILQHFCKNLKFWWFWLMDQSYYSIRHKIYYQFYPYSSIFQRIGEILQESLESNDELRLKSKSPKPNEAFPKYGLTLSFVYSYFREALKWKPKCFQLFWKISLLWFPIENFEDSASRYFNSC